MPSEYRFEIDIFTPLTLPMFRLAEYLEDLVELFGNRDHVHFLRVEEGSAAPVVIVDDPAIVKVDRRILQVRTGHGPAKALNAYRKLDDKLTDDNTSARLVNAGVKIIEFPGKNRRVARSIRSVREPGTLDGEVIMIGGRDETISIHVRSGDQIYLCTASREQGRKLAKHLFEGKVRIYGEGIWIRTPDGTWKLDGFSVDSFIPLRSVALSKAVAELRSLVPPGLGEVDDPIRFLSELNEVGNGPDEGN